MRGDVRKAAPGGCSDLRASSVKIALAHLARTIDEWRRFETDPWFALEGPGLGLVAAGLAFWAWRLLRASRQPS